MARAVLFQRRIRQEIEAALATINADPLEWYSDLTAAIRDHFKMPGDIQPQDSPWLYVSPGDFDLKTSPSLIQGQNTTLIYGAFVADPDRHGSMTPREMAEEIVGDVRKRVEQIANIDGWYVYNGLQADVTVDPEGAFGMFLITVTHTVRVRVAA